LSATIGFQEEAWEVKDHACVACYAFDWTRWLIKLGNGQARKLQSFHSLFNEEPLGSFRFSATRAEGRGDALGCGRVGGKTPTTNTE